MIVLGLPEIITISIAAYGAILSTFTLIQQRKDKKRIIDVVPSWGFLAYDHSLSEEAYIFIEVVNSGFVSVIVNTPYIKLPNRKTIVFPNATGDVTFPNELMPGHSCKIWTNANGIMNQLRKEGFNGTVSIKCGVKDATGKETIGKKKQKIKLN